MLSTLAPYAPTLTRPPLPSATRPSPPRLEALHQPNVSLVSDPIVAVTPSGLETKNGGQHDLDVIIWATGFDVSATGVGLNHGVHGESGRELREVWEAGEGAFAYLGVAVPDYPNYFTVLGPNAISMSWGYTLGNQVSSCSLSCAASC